MKLKISQSSLDLAIKASLSEMDTGGLAVGFTAPAENIPEKEESVIDDVEETEETEEIVELRKIIRQLAVEAFKDYTTDPETKEVAAETERVATEGEEIIEDEGEDEFYSDLDEAFDGTHPMLITLKELMSEDYKEHGFFSDSDLYKRALCEEYGRFEDKGLSPAEHDVLDDIYDVIIRESVI